jgi:protein ImuB
MSWFAAISLPQFSLQAALRLRGELWTQPVAVLDGESEKGFVLDMTEAAARCDVQPGMPSTQALARCADLRLLSRARVQEEALAALLLEAAMASSAFVEATREGLCVLDLRQVKTGDWEAWGRSVVERCAAMELRACIGIAANPDLAELAALRAEPVLVVHHTAAFLAGIAMAEIDAPAELIAVLRDWGISHLGELARLPRNDVVERLGVEAGDLWERASGRAQRELQWARPIELFFEAFDFEHPIDTTEPLLFILRRQLDQLTLRLREALRVAARMTLTIPLDNDTVYERVFTIPSPTRDTEVLFRILETHLEALRLDQQPNGVRLLIDPGLAASSQYRLFGTALRDPNRFGETLGRLAALVGSENVGVVELVDTHRPDSFRLVPPSFDDLREKPDTGLAESRTLGLPLRRFRPPLPAQVHLQRYIPLRVSSPIAHGEIIDAAGPYRASGNWWDRDVWSVEEWDVELGDGSLYRLSKFNDTWCVEGCYEAPVC